MSDKISQYLMYALILIGIVILLAGMIGENYNGMLYYSYALFGACVLMALVAAVKTSMSNTAKIKGSLIGIAALLLVVGISYGLASDEIIKAYGPDISPTVSRWSGAGLNAFYILLFGAFAAIAYSTVAKALK